MKLSGVGVDVLIVDDSIEDAELILGALRRRMPNVVALVARNGLEAIATLQDFPASAQPRVVFLDLKMSKVDGFEVLRRMKGHERTSSIPLVVLTSSSMDDDVRTAYSLGANSYVVKPMEFEKLVDTVGRLAEYWLRLDRGRQQSGH